MSDPPSMRSLVEDYLAYRRGLGFQLRNTGPLLLRFAEYADRTGHHGPLTTELALGWARLPAQASPTYVSNRLDAVRCFARYRAIFDPGTEVPPRGLIGSVQRRPAPYIYTEAELAALLAAAGRLSQGVGLRPHTYVALFGLLACTGLRISEALGLARQDVDWQQGLLTIRRSKFRKTRLVPLHPSATQALQAYAQQRDRAHPIAAADAFFLTTRGTPLRRLTAEATFRQLRQQVSLSAQGGRRPPRIHDIRHTFVCRRLLRWYEEGIDIDHAIAALSTYLGHGEVTDTYWYLTAIPDLMELATARFERFASVRLGD